MKKQFFINANIIDPLNSLNEIGGLIISEDGKIEAIGKKVNTNNLPSREKPIDLKGKYMMPIHWGRFNLSLHSWTDPIDRATKEASSELILICFLLS